jgi:23S rRNA (guanine745-N1)-methyltransferase
MALARRRLYEAGYHAPLLAALAAAVPADANVLDVGCGEGSALLALSRQVPLVAHGTDISAPAVDLAARALPEALWTVANADRFLPYASGAFNRVLSLTARLNPEEFRRVLEPDGRLLVAVPGEDDLVELREAVLGEGVRRSRWERAREELAPLFTLESHQEVRWRIELGPGSLRDLLAATYRGARASQRERVAALATREVTMSRALLTFRPTPKRAGGSG